MIKNEITAEQARSLSKTRIEFELEKVFSIIRNEAEKPHGNDFILLENGIWTAKGNIVESCIKELRKRGFDVKQTISEYIGNYTRISW